MKTDIQIAQEAKMEHIKEIAKNLDIKEDDLEFYGKYKAKLTDELWNEVKDRPDGKLILVTAINPTPAGEGKTTTSVGLGQAFGKLNKKAVIALREPSLGPCFGIKGGAAGGGYAQVVPMEDLNLHFTGDFHAIGAANNLLAAMMDNHIQQGNLLNIDPNQIVWKRCLDMNDRVLRNIVVGLGNKTDGFVREDHFIITVASEIMAILCLATSITDLKERLGRMVVGYTFKNEPVTAKELNAVGAMSLLLKDAIKPNLVQTLEGTPAFVHGGPFANIAHGCNSMLALKMAMKLGDITVTEAGFGADLGAEKFLDILCPAAGVKPDGVVMVATIRALKVHGGAELKDSAVSNVDALIKGCANLEVHLENMKKYGLPLVVAINHFDTDSEDEIAALTKWCEERGYAVSFLDGFMKGGKGSVDLAKKVMNTLKTKKSKYHPLYSLKKPIKEKIEIICKEIYRAGKIKYTPKAIEQIKRYEKLGYGDAYVCMAKTPQSITDDPNVLNAPKGFTITIREVNLSAGANFIVCLTGKILTLPGLPKVPAAVKMEDKPY